MVAMVDFTYLERKRKPSSNSDSTIALKCLKSLTPFENSKAFENVVQNSLDRKKEKSDSTKCDNYKSKKIISPDAGVYLMSLDYFSANCKMPVNLSSSPRKKKKTVFQRNNYINLFSFQSSICLLQIQ